MVKIIIEIEGGMIAGVYTNAPLDQDFEVEYLDHDCGSVDYESVQENERLDAVLSGSGWREID